MWLTHTPPHNEHGEPFTISHAALLENLIALEFPHTDDNIRYREILRNHIVEWMMGFPEDWTKVNDSRPSETP
jgi:hypothetical protein